MLIVFDIEFSILYIYGSSLIEIKPKISFLMIG